MGGRSAGGARCAEARMRRPATACRCEAMWRRTLRHGWVLSIAETLPAALTDIQSKYMQISCGSLDGRCRVVRIHRNS